MKFKIIIAAYNCQDWIRRCVDSVLNQTYTNWDLFIVEDYSTDNTRRLIRQHVTVPNIWLIHNTSNLGTLASQVKGIEASKPNDEDVIIIIDADDWLTNKESLQCIADAYNDPNVWMTYGSLVRYPSGKRGKNARAVKPDFDFRMDRWVLSHLRTFKYFLFKNILDIDLRYARTGEYYRASADCAVMKPLAEMAGHAHIKYIDELIYTYNQTNKSKIGRKKRSLQAKCGHEVRFRQKYKQRTKEELIEGITER